MACSKLRTFLFAWLHIIPASIFGSIISIADMASNSPKLESNEHAYYTLVCAARMVQWELYWRSPELTIRNVCKIERVTQERYDINRLHRRTWTCKIMVKGRWLSKSMSRTVIDQLYCLDSCRLVYSPRNILQYCEWDILLGIVH